MKLRKKALLPAIAMVLASVIALSGVTYAWFTTGITAEVQDLDVNVATANGIQVSLDAASWKTILTAQDIIDAIGDKGAQYSNRKIQYPDGEIFPVSTAGYVSNGFMQMYDGKLENGKLTTTAHAADTNGRTGNYVAFDLFIKSSSDKWDLTLKMGDSSVTGINVETGEATSIGTEKAVRVAFIPLGCAEKPSDARGLSAGPAKAIIWEPNAGTRANTGIDADSGELSYKGVKAAFTGADPAALTDDQGETVTVTTNDIDFDLGVGINKIRVYIWLEGQDVDCVNDISNGDFRVKLFFTLPDAAKEG